MALFRKLFFRKPPDGLLEICERVYVFDCCFSSDAWQEENYSGYIGGIVGQLRDHFPDASFLGFNFRDGERQSQFADVLSGYDMTIMEYPRQYQGCPLLTMEVIHHFLRSGESWLSLGQQNLLLMHCEWGGWPVLAFMLAALLIYRKQYSGEQKTLDMIYKEAPRELLQLLSPLNHVPSQLRYLQYVSRRNLASDWPPLDRALTLDCVILRFIPNIDGEGGCRPVFRIYGQDPLLVPDRTSKVLFSTPKKSKTIRAYKQMECELVKIDINCHIQGDIVLECISLNDDMEREEMMFRVVFNTAFIRSNILILNRDEVDTLWDAKDRFPKDFKAEILFSEMDAAESVVSVDFSAMEEKDGLPVEAFAKVHEIFSSVDWSDPKADAALNMLQQISTSNILQEMSETDFLAISPGRQVSSPTKGQESKMHTVGETSKLSVTKSESSESPKARIVVIKEAEVRDCQISYQPSDQSPTISPQTPQLPLGHDLKSLPHDISSSEHVQVPHTLVHSTASGQSLVGTTGREAMETKKYPESLATPASHSPQRPNFSSNDAKMPASSPPPPSPPPPHYLASETVDPSFPEETKANLCGNDHLASLSPQPPPKTPLTLSPSPTPALTPPPPPPPPPLPPLKENLNSKTGPSPTSALKEKYTITVGPSLPPPTPSLKENCIIRAGTPPPPPPPPPPTPPLKENCTIRAGPPSAPSPPTPPLKETRTVRAGPPPPPPPSTPPPPPPTPPLKDNRTISAGPPPPPPPPLRSRSVSTSPMPPPPPPPPASSNSPGIPAAPAPPVPSAPPPPGKGISRTSSGGDNLSRSPSPAPPSSSPASTKGRLSRTITSRSQQSKKLKPLHWLKLSRAVSGSLWADAQKSGEGSKGLIDMSELENLFSAAVPNSDSSGKSSIRGPCGSKPEKVQLVEHRRAYNCEIMLSKVKVPLQELMSSVLALEDSGLDVDQVENLIKFCPTKEEMDLLKGYTGEKEKLGKCELFFLELMKVPRVESKLRVFSFKMQFHSQVSDLRKSLRVVNSAADEIRNSAKLKRVMQTILSLGNALNQGTARGSAIGFRLDSLLKLTDTRARNSKMTLMHYLCKVLAEKLPELLDFSKDLVSLEPASKVQLKFLAEEMQAVSKGLEKVIQELSASENDGPISELFCKTLKEFLLFAEAEVRSLASLYSGVGRNVDALILYFGEDPARCPFEQVISTLFNFVRLFNKAHEENCKNLEREQKKLAKEKSKPDGSLKDAESLAHNAVQTIRTKMI